MRKVLIVEDDAALRSGLAAALSDEYLIRAVGGGREAVDLLQRQEIDVVLLDIVMAEGDGYMVLAHAATMGHRPLMIVVSVLDDPAKAVKIMKLGADDYVVKPCGAEAVRHAVHRLLRESPAASA